MSSAFLAPLILTPRSQSLVPRPPRAYHHSSPCLLNPPHARASPPKPITHDRKKKFEIVSWLQVETMCAHLATQAHDDRFDVILAITRGGLVPATLLCESLELRNILSVTAMFYTDSGDQFFGMTEPRFLSFPSADALEGRRVLIVDDVWDSGRTARAVKLRVQRARPQIVKVAVMHFKQTMNVVQTQPDFYCRTTENWVIYPWERVSPKVQFTEDSETVAMAEQESSISHGTG